MTISGIAIQPPGPPGVADVAGCGRYDHVPRAGDVQHLHPGRPPRRGPAGHRGTDVFSATFT
jgi:hypothetical protein